MMPRHESKQCPRCGKTFECKMGDITHCHCSDIKLSEEVMEFISMRYEDCLCHQCLIDLKNPQIFFTEKYINGRQAK